MKPTPKKTTPLNPSLKKTTKTNTAPKKTTPVKTTKPSAKKEVPPKTNPKKNTAPKTKVTKQTQKASKPKPKSTLNPPTKDNQSKVNGKKTIPKKTSATTLSYSSTSVTPYSVTEPTRDFSTVSFTIDAYGTTASLSPFHEPRINVTYVSSSTEQTEGTPLWFHDSTDSVGTTSDSFSVLNTPPGNINVEEVTMPSGTMPYSGEVEVASGIILSGDGMTVSYGDVGVAGETMVLHDSLTMVIPTIKEDDMTELFSSPWLDLSEYIPVSSTVPSGTSEPATLPATVTSPTARPTIMAAATTTATTAAPVKPQQNAEENNSVDVFYNRVVGVDNDISQNNLIPKRRINLRERTRNKRIQELLEEKRNFLLRMKRGHSTQ